MRAGEWVFTGEGQCPTPVTAVQRPQSTGAEGATIRLLGWEVTWAGFRGPWGSGWPQNGKERAKAKIRVRGRAAREFLRQALGDAGCLGSPRLGGQPSPGGCLHLCHGPGTLDTGHNYCYQISHS